MEKVVDVILSNTYFSSFEKIVEKAVDLSQKDKFANIILVVPDKFSLNAEQLLFEKLKKNAVCNIWIATLSRLVNKVIQDKTRNAQILSKNSGTMLVSEVILKNSDKISTYKKLTSNYKLAETMFNAINLLKSSGVMPEELKDNFCTTNFGLKIQDIYVIYSEYEKALLGKIDQNTRLKIFDENVGQNQYIQSADVLFGYFDSFTNAQMSSVCKIAKTAKSFSIGLCANTLQKNANIYDNVVFQRLKSKFDEQFVKYSIKNFTAKLNPFQNQIAKNIFCFETVSRQETDALSLIQCQNVDEEVRFVASEIKYQILSNHYTFDDINVAICGLNDYQNAIERIFGEFDFSFYIDKNRQILSHYFVRTILKIFDFICGYNSISDAVAIAKSPIFDFPNESKDCFENYCIKHNVFGSMLYRPFDFEHSVQENTAESVRKIFDDIKIFDSEISACKNVAGYIDCIYRFLTKIGAKNSIERFSEKQSDIVQRQLDSQVYDSFCAVLDEANSLLADDEMDKSFFFDMLANDYSSVGLKTVPLKCDSIFVGDTTDSTFFPRKILYVLGASHGKMPAYQNDYGTITDSEIANFKAIEHITPTIKELNKRQKFKIFNLLLSASDKLQLSYSLMANGEALTKSEFVTELQRLFCKNGKELPIFKADDLFLQSYGNLKMLPFVVGTPTNAVKILNQTDLQSKFARDTIKTNMPNLSKMSVAFKDDENRFQISNPKQAMFPFDYTSSSQIEKYFACPFSQFLNYAIRPQERQEYEIQTAEIGTLMHEFAKNFVVEFLKDKTCNTDLLAQKILNEILLNPDYDKIKNDIIMRQNLEQEVKRFALALKNQIEVGKYVPLQEEKQFAGYVLKSGIKLKGTPDRVDVCMGDNSLRIIDYKTGNQQFDFKDVYYGVKVQLILYLKIMAEKFRKRPTGAFYMPVRNKYKSGGDFLESYKLDGIVLDDSAVLFNYDTGTMQNPPHSFVLDIYKKGQKNVEPQKKSKMLTDKQFDELQDYVLQIVNNAVDEMLSGYILPKPEKDACANCKFNAICRYDAQKNGYRKFETKTKESFSKEKSNGDIGAKN